MVNTLRTKQNLRYIETSQAIKIVDILASNLRRVRGSRWHPCTIPCRTIHSLSSVYPAIEVDVSVYSLLPFSH